LFPICVTRIVLELANVIPDQVKSDDLKFSICLLFLSVCINTVYYY
jgi:hypothetical protein